jgi:hypothetical protein
VRPLSWLILLALAGAAMAGPQRLAPFLAQAKRRAVSLDPARLASAAPLPAHDAAASAAGMEAVAELEGLLQGAVSARTAMPEMEGGAPEAGAPLSAEERQILAEITPSVELKMNPLMAAMLEKSRSGATPGARRDSLLESARYIAMAHRVYQENQARLVGVIWGAPALLIVGALALSMMGAKGTARTLAGACHSIAGKALWGLSLSAIVMFATSRADLWSSLPNDLWVVPAWSIVASAFILRAIDMNAPVWNGTLMSLLAPLVSCGVVLGWDRMAGLTKLWLEKGA